MEDSIYIQNLQITSFGSDGLDGEVSRSEGFCGMVERTDFPCPASTAVQLEKVVPLLFFLIFLFAK